MVTLRGRDREDPDQRGGSPQRPAKSSQFPQRARAETRSRSTVHQPDGVYGEDDEQNHVDSETQEDEDEEAVRFILRKSPKLQSSSGVGRKIGLRRSNRMTKPTCRYPASNIFDGISTKSVLTRINNMKKIRWLSNNKEGVAKIRVSAAPVHSRFTSPSDSCYIAVFKTTRLHSQKQ